MATLTPEQFDKLPKYARDYITDLRRDVEDAQRIRAKVLNTEPTPVYVEHYTTAGEERRQYIKATGGVVFELGHEGNIKRPRQIMVRINHEKLVLMGTGHPSGLSVRPQSSNVVVVGCEGDF